MIKSLLKLIIVLTSFALLVSCTNTNSIPTPNPKFKAPTTRHSLTIREKLLQHHSDWQGTPYKLGGTNRQGIDCSAFVQLTYRQIFNIKTARTTVLLSTQGMPINKQQLQTGDLVFFKHKSGLRHVGVYLGNQQFLHASTKRGVTISKLNSRYWLQRYWQARRLL